MLALPDIRTANKTVEMILKAAAYALAPPLMVLHDGVLNPDTLSLAPRSLIRVARTGGPMGRSIEPLNLGQNVDVGQIVLEDLRQNISRTCSAASCRPTRARCARPRDHRAHQAAAVRRRRGLRAAEP
jgi:hypothetical protein